MDLSLRELREVNAGYKQLLEEQSKAHLEERGKRSVSVEDLHSIAECQSQTNKVISRLNTEVELIRSQLAEAVKELQDTSIESMSL